VVETGCMYTPNGKYSKETSRKGQVRNRPMRRRPSGTGLNACATGYYSAVACFTANQAYRTKSRVMWDKKWDLTA